MSGCMHSPCFSASRQRSCSIFVRCALLVVRSRMSSAKRRLVSCVSSVCPRFIPKFFCVHVGLSCWNTFSSTALKRSELSGSPCFTPLAKVKVRLRLSVLTCAVCPLYMRLSRLMYGGGTCCRARACQMWLWFTVSKAFWKSMVAIHKGSRYSLECCCSMVNVYR